uniref:Myb/SANT-like domain-containing protein n=1 Tax=Zea mays TaxID=4577 RepID=A0A804Q7J9_MAIZE
MATQEVKRRQREVTVWQRRIAPTASLLTTLSPIPTTPIIVGKGEPPPSWDPVPTPKAMAGKGSPSGAKKSGGSIRVVKQRVDWNPGLKRSLVNILHEFKDSGYRNDNGWNSEGWNRMVKEFHVRNKTLG